MRQSISGILIFSSFLVSCSTPTKIQITSFPEKAEVKATSSEGETKILGVTPLSLSSRELFSSGSHMSTLTVTKENYEQQNIFIAQESGLENYDIKVKLKQKTEDSKSSDLKNRHEKLAKSLTRASSLINNKKYEEAERILLNVSQEYPHVSVSYDLLGNISYFRRDIKTALHFYEKSFHLNSENQETKNMIDKLKGMVNTL